MWSETEWNKTESNETERENATPTHVVAPARIVSQQRRFWRVAGDFGECLAEASGKLRLAAEAGAQWPAVGDWAAVELHEPGTSVIHLMLPRRNGFVRKAPGKKLQEQIIAANLDLALVISAFGSDFNPRRVERYLAQCWESGVRPVIVLNKADTCDDALVIASEMQQVALSAPVYVVSALTGEGMGEIEALLKPGQTIVALGSSGVGKSTLTNRLLGQPVQQVKEVRAQDGRGRHTTTARELFALPCGALLIDTPGLRALELWDAEDGVAQTFADIESLSARCRFRDCRHEAEPGCAVQAALNSGALPLARVENRSKLLREQEFLRRKVDPAAREKEKQRIKRLTRGVRQAGRDKQSND